MNLNFPVRIETEEERHAYEEQRGSCTRFGCVIVAIAFVLAFTLPFIITFLEHLR